MDNSDVVSRLCFETAMIAAALAGGFWLLEDGNAQHAFREIGILLGALR
ncbi:MAG: hypothetical protein AAF844_07835 [Pseudomonadota bacterium]